MKRPGLTHRLIRFAELRGIGRLLRAELNPRLQWRRLRRAGVPGLSVLLLCLAGTAMLFAPLPRTSCAPAVPALLTGQEELPSGRPAEIPADVAAADARAVTVAQAAVDEHESVLSAARAGVSTAETRLDKAESAVYDAENDDPYELQWDVDSARSAVEVDKDVMSYSSPGDYGYADDQDELATDQAALTKAEAALTTAKAANKRTKAAAETKRATADAALGKANDALSEAESTAARLGAAVDAATKTQSDRVIANRAGAAAFAYVQRLQIDAARARNGVISSCASASVPTAAVGGGLLLLAVLIGTGNGVIVRRNRIARLPSISG